MTSSEAYCVNQLASGIKVGDKVKIVDKAMHRERGWAANWPSEMDGLVGTTHLVLDNYGDCGFYLSCYFTFPYFVLEVVKEA